MFGIRTAESLVPEPSALEMVVEKIKRHKSPGIDQIPAQLIKAGGRTIRSEIHKLVNSTWTRRNCLRSGRSRSLCLFIKRVTKRIVVITEAYGFCQIRTEFYPKSYVKVNSICSGKYWDSSM